MIAWTLISAVGDFAGIRHIGVAYCTGTRNCRTVVAVPVVSGRADVYLRIQTDIEDAVQQSMIPAPAGCTQARSIGENTDHSVPVACGIAFLQTTVGRGVPQPSCRATIGIVVAHTNLSVPVTGRTVGDLHLCCTVKACGIPNPARTAVIRKEVAHAFRTAPITCKTLRNDKGYDWSSAVVVCGVPSPSSDAEIGITQTYAHQAVEVGKPQNAFACGIRWRWSCAVETCVVPRPTSTTVIRKKITDTLLAVPIASITISRIYRGCAIEISRVPSPTLAAVVREEASHTLLTVPVASKTSRDDSWWPRHIGGCTIEANRIPSPSVNAKIGIVLT